MAAAFEIPTKDISRTSEMFREVIPTEVKVTMASDVAARMMSNFTMIPDETRRRLRMRIIRICEQVQESNELMGKTPKTIAAGVIRIVTQLEIQVVCELCGVSAPTIKKIEGVLTAIIH